MKDVYVDFLFNRHILVDDGEISKEGPDTVAFATLIALGQKFGIRVTKNAQHATESMIRVAERNLGEYVPEPFYRGFPESVRSLTTDQLLFDQMYHYIQTYGCGFFDEPGHSIMEEDFKRIAFKENVEPKEFVILPEKQAEEELKTALLDLVSSPRPLSLSQSGLIVNGYFDYGKEVIPEKIPCKRTAIELLYRTKNVDFARFLKLPDVIKLLDYIQYYEYGSEKLNKLNLKNKDRKLISKVIDFCFDKDRTDFSAMSQCMANRKIWCGLLHHLHYVPKMGEALYFVKNCIRERDGTTVSPESMFEAAMRLEGPVMATKILKEYKGTGAVLRNLNYILSRCENEMEVKEVFKCLN